MEHTEYDMEVTPERAAFIKNLLLMLYADQMGYDPKDITVTEHQKEQPKEPA